MGWLPYGTSHLQIRLCFLQVTSALFLYSQVSHKLEIRSKGLVRFRLSIWGEDISEVTLCTHIASHQETCQAVSLCVTVWSVGSGGGSLVPHFKAGSPGRDGGGCPVDHSESPPHLAQHRGSDVNLFPFSLATPTPTPVGQVVGLYSRFDVIVSVCGSGELRVPPGGCGKQRRIWRWDVP